jgi:hypothetical protein
MTAIRLVRLHAARGLAAIAVASLVVACSPSAGVAGPIASPEPTTQPSVVQSPDVTPPPSATTVPTAVPSESSATPSSSAAGSATPAPTGTTIVRAYFLRGDATSSAGLPYHLVPVLRVVPETKGVARAALTQLLAAPPATFGTEIPSGTSLLGISIDASGTATVDLSAGFASGGTSASQVARAAEVVFTVTQFANVKDVLFQAEGAALPVPDDAGHARTDAVGRADYRDLLPAIFVDRPAYAAAIGNPAHVTGLANVFEATFRVRLVDGSGRSLADQQAMATCGTGCWGTFDVSVRYDVPTAQWGTLRVYDLSAKDGSPENVVEEPVWLTPAG